MDNLNAVYKGRSQSSRPNLLLVVWACQPNMNVFRNLSLYFWKNLTKVYFLKHLKHQIDLEVPIDAPASYRGFFWGNDFLKAHPKPWKIRHVSTLAVGAFTCGGPLSTLSIRLFKEFYRFVVILTFSLFFGLVYDSEHWIIPWIYVNVLIKSYFCQDG